jgi:hypothetical protein
MKILIAILFLTNLYELSSQSVNNYGRTTKYLGKGSIDNNLSITFELDAIDRPHYVDQCYIGVFEQFIGRYYYDKFEQYINIVGTKITKFEERQNSDTITLFELDENFNKIATFKGLIVGNKFNGVWSKYNKNKNLSFSITFDSNKFTELYVSTPKGIFTLPIDHENKFNQNEFEVIKVKEYEDKTFVLLKLNLTHCSALNCRGHGCGGTNLYLRLYEIQNRSYKIHESFLQGYGYDGNARDLMEEKIGEDFYKAKIRQYNGENTETYYSVDVNFAEIHKGIRKMKL